MCNYSEGIYNKGVKAGMQQGMQQGEILLSMLIKKLMQDSRNEDVLEVTEDADYREKLYIEYGIK